MTLFIITAGATLIDPNEMDELIPMHITTQAELNEWEQANIVEAKLWLSNKKFTADKILNQLFIKKLHQKMFIKTWSWAGKFRKTDKNIGCDWLLIPIQLKQLFDDIEFQLLHRTYTIDEIAARFHHRLVSIHPFVNGNGRFSRLATDLLLSSQEQKIFSWGEKEKSARDKYLQALRAADARNYLPLLNFVRT